MPAIHAASPAAVVPHSRRIRWTLVVVTGLHGVVHLLAPADIWGWVALEEEVHPSVALGTGTEQLLGVAWVVATALLVAAATLIALRRPVWRIVAATGVVLSQALIVLWWEAANAGTVANALIVAAAVWARPLGLIAAPPATRAPCCTGEGAPPA